MNESILVGIQIATSIWEIWMCYQLLLLTVIDEKYRTQKDKIIMWCAVIFAGLLLGFNRLNSFFSSPVFVLMHTIFIIICIFLNIKSFAVFFLLYNRNFFTSFIFSSTLPLQYLFQPVFGLFFLPLLRRLIIASARQRIRQTLHV